ncbi:MAG: type II CAAX endopeptidase family protein [Tunicatimonas sp.]|uniref:CPBP family intramembrane glutamic endopeptidase n=1 Tax=Tunicatimonas sp. TaxID=1940096 RepID=UPI003C76F400
MKRAVKNNQKYRRNLKYLSVYTILSIILLLVAAFTEDSLEILVIWTVAFAIIDLVFAYLQPTVWTLFFSKIEFKPLMLIVIIGVTTGFLVSLSMDSLNLVLFEESYTSLPLFEDAANPLLLNLVITAMCPAIFEELSFRGFVFTNLDQIAGRKSAVWGSAFLFGLVHFSLLSLVWLIPFGLLLAYFRNRYSTLVYGVVGHFTHNATTILLEYYGLLGLS